MSPNVTKNVLRNHFNSQKWVSRPLRFSTIEEFYMVVTDFFFILRESVVNFALFIKITFLKTLVPDKDGFIYYRLKSKLSLELF